MEPFPCGSERFILSTNQGEYTVVDLRRRPEGAMAPLREEKAINKAHKLLLEGAKSIDYCFLTLL